MSSTKRIGSSNIASRSSFVKLGEPLAVDGVVFFEAADVEPVAGEFRRQAPSAAVLQHPPGLGGEHVRLVQIAGGGVLHQLLVRHARPEEVAQAAGECVVGERLDIRCLARRRSPDVPSERRRIDAVTEIRRHQHAGHRVANRFLVAEMLFAQRTVEARGGRRLPPSSAAGDTPAPRTPAAPRGASVRRRPWPAPARARSRSSARSSRGPRPSATSLVTSRALAR